MSDLFNGLLEFVDTNQLQYVEELREGLNRGRLVQGNPEFEKDAQLNQTVRYLGGIGLSLDGLSENIVKQGTIVTINEKDFVTFPSLEVVPLTNARIRRFYADVEGNSRLACGTNQDGAHAKGWSGVACKQCEFFPKNYVAAGGKKDDACRAEITILAYIPAFDHVAILSFHGASYMEAIAWTEQSGKLCRAFAQRAEVQASMPGLARVNHWFFRTTLSAGSFEKGNDNNSFQRLVYTKAEQPYQWDKLLNPPQVIKRAKELWAELEEPWKQLYVGHNANAVMALSSADAVAAIPAQSSAVERVVVPAAALMPALPPAPTLPAASITVPSMPPALTVPVTPAIVPAMPALPPTLPSIPMATAPTLHPAIPPALHQAPAIPGVVQSAIALDDDVTPVTAPIGF